MGRRQALPGWSTPGCLRVGRQAGGAGWETTRITITCSYRDLKAGSIPARLRRSACTEGKPHRSATSRMGRRATRSVCERLDRDWLAEPGVQEAVQRRNSIRLTLGRCERRPIVRILGQTPVSRHPPDLPCDGAASSTGASSISAFLLDTSSAGRLVESGFFVSKIHLFRTMNSFIFSIFLFLSVLASSVPASAQTYQKITADQLQGLLKSEGYASEIDSDGDILWKLDGVKTLVLIQGEGAFLLFRVSFKSSTDRDVMLTRVNEWNRTKRFSRSYLDKDGDPALESDLDMTGGVERERILDFLKTCRDLVNPWVNQVVNVQS